MADKRNIIVIGSSTGGPKLLNSIFGSLPRLDASIIVVQHVPPFFDARIAERLNELCSMTVKLPDEGERLENSTVYFARADMHLRLQHNMTIRLEEGDKVNCCIPSVDATMMSLKRNHDGWIVGAVLTGMGSDGADGISHIKDIGGVTIAQNEESCVIFGMPKAAIATGKVDYILHADEIVGKLIQLVGEVR